MEEEIKETTEAEDLIDTLADGVVAIDKESRIISFSEGAEHITGFTLDEVIGKLNLSETAETIVGGYHALDCVVEMAKVLRRNNFNVQVNPLLTNELAFLLISHLARVNYILKERKLDLDIWKMKKEDLQNAINK